MTLIQFKRFIYSIKDYYEKEELLSKALEPFNSSYTIIEFCPSIVSSIYDYLEEEFGDKDKWILYWIHDLNYGTNLDLMEGCSYKDGTKIDISSIEKLYEFLIENQKE